MHTYSFGRKLALTCLFFFIGLFVSSLIVLFFANQTSSVNLFKGLQLAQSICTFLLPAIFLAYLFGGANYLSFATIHRWPIWLIVVFVMPMALPVVNLLKAINDTLILPDFLSGVELWMQQMESQAAELTEKFLQVSSFSDFLLNLLVLAFVPAVAEEFFFRGILQRIFSDKMNKHYAVWITAFLFSAIHLQFYGFFPRLLLGAVLGYLYVATGSLWAPIVAHFMNNGLAVISSALEQKGLLSVDVDTIGTGHGWWVGVLSAMLVSGGLLIILLRGQKK